MKSFACSIMNVDLRSSVDVVVPNITLPMHTPLEQPIALNEDAKIIVQT